MADKMTSIREFGQRILAGVQADIDDLPKGAMVAWFDGLIFKPTEKVPFDQFSIVIAIFHNDEVARVYSMPAAPPSSPPPPGWLVKAPVRYTLSLRAPTYVAEVMEAATMADEIIDEWNEVADGMSSAELEREAIIDFIAATGEITAGGQPLLDAVTLVQQLRDGLHLQDEDDDKKETDEDDGEDKTDTIPAPSSGPPAPPPKEEMS